MTPEARDMLDILDTFLSRLDKPAEEVATVLCALRAGDSGRVAVKLHMTLPIRGAALPKTCQAVEPHRRSWGGPSLATGPYTHMAFPYDEETRQYRSQPGASTHYGQHADAAAKVLGLLEDKA